MQKKISFTKTSESLKFSSELDHLSYKHRKLFYLQKTIESLIFSSESDPPTCSQQAKQLRTPLLWQNTLPVDPPQRWWLQPHKNFVLPDACEQAPYMTSQTVLRHSVIATFCSSTLKSKFRRLVRTMGVESMNK